MVFEENAEGMILRCTIIHITRNQYNSEEHTEN